MKVKFKQKFAEQDIDEVVFAIYANYSKNNQDSYIFDLTEVEFIGNQELLVFSSILKLFVLQDIQFEVLFFKKGIPTSQINDRIKKQIIQIWEVWQIWRILPNEDYHRYFGIDGNSVRILKKELNYQPKSSEIYTRHGVTPFISLDYIHNYNENEVQLIIHPIYQLNSIIKALLRQDNCYHPFTSQSLSTIITEELYLNFLDHSQESSFKGLSNMAFFSISFQGKLDVQKNSPEKIQQIKKLNFETEALRESKNFYFNQNKGVYKNVPHIQFSFLDFGIGIVNTLKDAFLKQHPYHVGKDAEILKFAFDHFSSRHSVKERAKEESFIPRGLFDAFILVKRYKGLMIIRSNHAKILYDFADNGDNNRGQTFSDEKFYFPGTLISIYLPAIDENSGVLTEPIKPEIDFNEIKPENKRYVNFTEILDNLATSKEELYDSLFLELTKNLGRNKVPTLTFLSFEGTISAEKRVLKKALYFLLTDYDINHFNNVVILNFPKKEVLTEIEQEILNLNEAIQNYKIHPLPIVDYNVISEELCIKWLGVFNEDDQLKLNELLFEGYSIAFSDFKNPNKVIGHMNAFDKFGNLKSNFPSRKQIVEFYERQRHHLYEKQILELLDRHECIEKGSPDSLFLCNSNYYQNEYIELTNLINDERDCPIVSKMLFDAICWQLPDRSDIKYIGITTTSQKLLKSLELQGLITSDDYITLDSYHTFEDDPNLEKIDPLFKYILICDVLATGSLTLRLNTKLKECGTSLACVGVLINSLSPNLSESKRLVGEFKDRIIYLYKYKIEKYRKTEFNKEILNKQIIRINPYTNRPITSSINETLYSDSVIFQSVSKYDPISNSISIQNSLLDTLKPSDIRIGYLKHNNLIHPYFFETKNILENMPELTLQAIFKSINNTQLHTCPLQIFYPRKSGIEHLDFHKVKKALNNHSVKVIEIDRYGTPEGWRFPHSATSSISNIEDSICFILDDGSCSGDSLIQMIDEVAFHEAKEIVLLSFFGRVNDHKREFFSRLSNIKVKNSKVIPVSIFFVSLWHIPTYYIDENPNTKEVFWLNDVINLANTPQSIKEIAGKVLNAITPKSDLTYKDYRYLPKVRNTKKIPKKDMLLVREELGKVIGYRLYKESFSFFDNLFKKYENKVKSPGRYKEIELLCATFIYEPYLYDKIKGLMPDVVEHIQHFVDVLLFSNEKITGKLTYKWDPKDIIHLFFIVYKDEHLLAVLKNNLEKFEALIEFTKPKEVALNYVLYKLLFYFPIKVQHLEEKKYDRAFKDLLFKISERNEGNIELKKFYNFITSLPTKSDFPSQISSLRDGYLKQNQEQFHDKKISFNHNISLTIVTLRACKNIIQNDKEIGNDKLDTIKALWLEILNFVNPILIFSSSFGDFLMPYPNFRQFNSLEGTTNSLRWIVGYNEDVIFSLKGTFKDQEKLNNLERYITKIQTDIGINSTFYELIINPTSNLNDFLNQLYHELNTFPGGVNMPSHKIDPLSRINIPELYTRKLIKDELVANLKNHADPTDPKIGVTVRLNGDTVFLILENKAAEQGTKPNTGEGTKCLKLLESFSPFGFTYDPDFKNKPDFIQTLTFKILP